MTIFIIIMLSLILLGGGGGMAYSRAISNKSVKAIAPKHKFTNPAKKLIEEYNSLPKESRPFPDIESVVKGLDEKHALDRKALHRHFNTGYGYDDNDIEDFTWSSYRNAETCYYNDHKKCPYKDYIDIHEGIKDIKDALAEKERALHVANTKHSADMAKELIAALRDEAMVNRQTAKELTRGS